MFSEAQYLLAILVKGNFYDSVFDEILQCGFISFPFFTDVCHHDDWIRQNRFRGLADNPPPLCHHTAMLPRFDQLPAIRADRAGGRAALTKEPMSSYCRSRETRPRPILATAVVRNADRTGGCFGSESTTG